MFASNSNFPKKDSVAVRLASSKLKRLASCVNIPRRIFFFRERYPSLLPQIVYFFLQTQVRNKNSASFSKESIEAHGLLGVNNKVSDKCIYLLIKKLSKISYQYKDSKYLE